MKKNLEELRRIARQAQLEVLEAEKLLSRIEQGEPTGIAELLHELDCRSNHPDGCGWLYESWENPSYAP